MYDLSSGKTSESQHISDLLSQNTRLSWTHITLLCVNMFKASTANPKTYQPVHSINVLTSLPTACGYSPAEWSAEWTFYECEISFVSPLSPCWWRKKGLWFPVNCVIHTDSFTACQCFWLLREDKAASTSQQQTHADSLMVGKTQATGRERQRFDLNWTIVLYVRALNKEMKITT